MPTRRPSIVSDSPTSLVDRYFEIGEISILRSWLGLPLRHGDLEIAALREPEEAEGDEESAPRPVRIRQVDSHGPVTDLSEAVARICLSGVQGRLPQWALVGPGHVVEGRTSFGERTLEPLEPVKLLCINWADSGPGYSWPEEYNATFLPGFGRHVVTASSDSIDSYGVLDFAIGHFPDGEPFDVGPARVILDWWKRCAEQGSQPWSYTFDAGAISEERARELRSLAWETPRE